MKIVITKITGLSKSIAEQPLLIGPLDNASKALPDFVVTSPEFVMESFWSHPNEVLSCSSVVFAGAGRSRTTLPHLVAIDEQ
jgi:hypothetical protein